jgi:hypothetical protein
MEGWWAGAVLAAAGVFAISGAVRYRSGRHPEPGRHREVTGVAAAPARRCGERGGWSRAAGVRIAA